MTGQDPFNLDAERKKIADEEKRVRRKEIDDVKAILKTSHGRRFIWRIWEKAHMFKEPFAQNSNQTGYNLGRMSIGREILNDVNEADWTAFSKIQQEEVSALLSKNQAKEVTDARISD